MQKKSITKELARKIILQSQLLTTSDKSNKKGNSLLSIIDSLGYVQIDTISVINRAHHHILWTRNSVYEENDLHDLQTKERAVFEYWGHAMSYLPMKDYRFYLPKMKKFQSPSSNWAIYMLGKGQNAMQPVMDRIKAEGPLSAKDFKTDKVKGGTWWDWKPAKIALELLFWKGDLMVTERKNFQKYYDLKERVLPDNIDTTYPTDDELSKFLILRAFKAMGIASEKEIRKFLQPGTIRDADIQMVGTEIIRSKLQHLQEEKKVVPLQIENNKTTYYTLQDNLNSENNSKESNAQVHLLSPFDGLVIQRERAKDIFDFDYTIECYVPEKKRKYGYFVLPLLWGENLIGRLDPKADRKNKTLIINNLFFEPYFNDFDSFLPFLSKKLIEFARFNGCEKIELGFKGKIKNELKSLIKKN